MTDLANLANLLSPPEKAGNKKNRTKFLVEYTVFENPSKVLFYTTLRAKTLFGRFSNSVEGSLSALVGLCSYALLPLLSSSMGCLRAVMSRNEHRKRTTTSRSFFTGETCRRSHKGVPREGGKRSKSRFSGSALIGENWRGE